MLGLCVLVSIEPEHTGRATSPRDSTHRCLCPQLSISGAAAFPLPCPPRLPQRLSSYHLPECLSSQHAWEAGKRRDYVLRLGNQITEGEPTALQEPVAEEWDRASVCALCPGSMLISGYSVMLSCKVAFHWLFSQNTGTKTAWCFLHWVLPAIAYPCHRASEPCCSPGVQEAGSGWRGDDALWQGDVGRKQLLCPLPPQQGRLLRRLKQICLSSYYNIHRVAMKIQMQLSGMTQMVLQPKHFDLCCLCDGSDLQHVMKFIASLSQIQCNYLIQTSPKSLSRARNFFQMVETKSILEMLSPHYPWCTHTISAETPFGSLPLSPCPVHLWLQF